MELQNRRWIFIWLMKFFLKKKENEDNNYEENVGKNTNSFLESIKVDKENNEWQVKSQDKDMVDVILPDLMDTIADLSEEFGEYGD